MWILISAVTLLFTLIYIQLVKVHKYWHDQGVAYEKPTFIFGNFATNIFRIKSIPEIILHISKKFSKHRYVGLFQFSLPALLILDIDLIKQITVKDFDSFPDHMTFFPADIDPLWGKNLLQMTVKDGWQTVRAMLSPSFTSSKMKAMFVLMQDCSKQFIEYFQNQNKVISVNVKDVFTRFANDVIGTTAFGITCDSLRYPENEFYLRGKEGTDFSGLNALKFFGYVFSPKLMKLLGIKVFNNRVAAFFRKTIKETLDYRKSRNIIRPDMIHLMIEAQKNQNAQNDNNKQFTELTEESMTAQALIFFSAGFESVSSAMSFLVYELTINPDIQQKLYEEISETLTDGSTITYDLLFEMKYLDCVVSESLRLHTPVPVLDRKCAKPYTINPVLPWEKPVHLQEGTTIWIPAIVIHNDEQFYPNPEKFDPERFNTEDKSRILPPVFLPFGHGPRNCIGSRFALMEIKLILVELLQNFELVPNEKTKIPLKLSKTNFNSIPDEGIWLSFKPRKLK